MRQLNYATHLLERQRKYLWQYAAVPEPNVPQEHWLTMNHFSEIHPDDYAGGHPEHKSLVAVFSLKYDKYQEARSFNEFRATRRAMSLHDFQRKYGVDDEMNDDSIEYVHVYMRGLYLYQYKYSRPYKFWMPLDNGDMAGDSITELELALYEWQKSYNQDEKLELTFHAKIKWLIKLVRLTRATADMSIQWEALQDVTDSDDSTAEEYPFNISFDDHYSAVADYLTHQLSLI